MPTNRLISFWSEMSITMNWLAGVFGFIDFFIS